MSKTVYFVVHDFSGEAGGGVNRVVTETANEMAKYEEYDVNVLSLAPLTGTAYPISNHVRLHSLQMKKHSTSQYKSIFKLIWLFTAFVRVFSFYRSQKKQSVWNLTSPPLIILFAIFRKYNNKFIYCEHTSPLGRKTNFLINKVRSLVLNTGDITISLNKKDDEYYKKNHVNSHLIYNGSTFPEIIDFHKSKIIIFVGRFAYEKNPLEALEIFYESRLWERGYTMRFFGMGHYLEDLKLKVQNLNILEFVDFITNEKNANNIYKDASCLIMTSRYEGFGMVLIEAMSRGIPCISYNCPEGPSEIIKNGVNGYLVENANRNDFIEQLASKKFENLEDLKIIDSVQDFNIKKVVYYWKCLINNWVLK